MRHLSDCGRKETTAFSDPDKFDITRKQTHLAFGQGQHFCVGAPLA